MSGMADPNGLLNIFYGPPPLCEYQIYYNKEVERREEGRGVFLTRWAAGSTSGAEAFMLN